jgi:hypothetical protein
MLLPSGMLRLDRERVLPEVLRETTLHRLSFDLLPRWLEHFQFSTINVIKEKSIVRLFRLLSNE